ncbi:MAG: hypothetical protein JWN70_6711, partial [Planctomycetaceae bacterium]|nr:hypothetical protein [Planctomycetaceae bacterium]
AARRTALVNDLRRTRLGYVLAHLACRLLTWSPIVRVDGPRSVAGAFTEQEVLLLAARAGYKDPHLSQHWPQRYLLRCDRR